jgi:hypothetical protein
MCWSNEDVLGVRVCLEQLFMADHLLDRTVRQPSFVCPCEHRGLTIVNLKPPLAVGALEPARFVPDGFPAHAILRHVLRLLKRGLVGGLRHHATEHAQRVCWFRNGHPARRRHAAEQVGVVKQLLARRDTPH